MSAFTFAAFDKSPACRFKCRHIQVPPWNLDTDQRSSLVRDAFHDDDVATGAAAAAATLQPCAAAGQSDMARRPWRLAVDMKPFGIMWVCRNVINHPFFIFYTTHLWWYMVFRGYKSPTLSPYITIYTHVSWFIPAIIAIPTLSPFRVENHHWNSQLSQQRSWPEAPWWNAWKTRWIAMEKDGTWPYTWKIIEDSYIYIYIFIY